MTNAKKADELKEKYGPPIDDLLRHRPADALKLIGWRDRLDPHFTKIWLDFTFAGLRARKVLDDRTRSLVAIGQLVCFAELEDVEGEIRGALANGLSPREILEVIIQASVYCGSARVDRAGRLFARIVDELGRADELVETQPPIDGINAGRNLEQERSSWGRDAQDFPRREELFDKYGWHGISTGLRVQPAPHPKAVDWLDGLDPSFLKLWLDFIYTGLYSRTVLDDRTRTLCALGACAALRIKESAEIHMRSALALGASPREILEVLVQSTQYVGVPGVLALFRDLQRVVDDAGLAEELEASKPNIDRNG